MNPTGYPSNEDETLVDHGYPGCATARAQPDPPPSAYTNGVVTPHAAFLALRWAPREAVENLRRLERDFPGMYGKWGFRDTVNVDSGVVSGVLPLARPGHHHGRDRQRARRRPAAPRVRHAGDRAQRAPGDRRGGVQQRPARLHDHRHPRRRPAARDRARRRHLRPRRRRPDRRARRRRRRLRRRRPRPRSRAATAPTRSTAARATTPSRAAPATTCCRAARARIASAAAPARTSPNRARAAAAPRSRPFPRRPGS